MQTNAQYFIISNLISPHVLIAEYHAMIAKVWTTPAYILYFITFFNQNFVKSIAPAKDLISLFSMHLLEEQTANLYMIFLANSMTLPLLYNSNSIQHSDVTHTHLIGLAKLSLQCV